MSDSKEAKQRLIDIRDEILSEETRELVRKFPIGDYKNKLLDLSKTFIEAFVAYAQNCMKLKIHKMVLYTGSHLLQDQYRLATYYPIDGDKRWSSTSRGFTEFIFTKDDEVRHLITEAIWHFKPRICPAVFIGTDARGISEYNGDKIVLKCWQLPQQRLREAEKVIKKCGNGDFNAPQLWKILFADEKITESLQTAGEKLKSFLQFPQKARYKLDNLKRLFAHIIYEANSNVHSNGGGDYPRELRNIIYLPDVRPNPLSGGAVVVFDYSQDGSKISAEKIYDLQEAMSNYYFASVAAVESERFVIGVRSTHWDYPTHYFSSRESCKEFIEEILKACKKGFLKKAKERSKFEKVVRELLNVLPSRRFLLRGYGEISARIFVGVCKLWNILNLEDNVAEIPEKHLIQIEQDVTKFEQKPIGKKESGSSFLRLLCKALNFEDSLKAVPSYRDHFIHSFHVFCLGLWVVGLGIIKSNGKRWNFTDLTLKQWFYAAFIHDIGYSLEKIEDLADTFIYSMIEHDGVRPVVPMNPNWGHLATMHEIRNLYQDRDLRKKIPCFIENIITNKKFRIDGNNKEIYINIVIERMLHTAFHKADHGLVSGMLLYHSLKSKANDHVNKKSLQVSKIFPAIFAAMIHQCDKWEWHWPNCEEKIKLDDEIRVKQYDLPIAHLLILCDSLAQFGREFDDPNMAEAKGRTIRLKNIDSNAPTSPELTLLYEGWNDDHNKKYEASRIAEEYYNKRRIMLDCPDRSKQKTTELKVILDFENPHQSSQDAYPARYLTT